MMERRDGDRNILSAPVKLFFDASLSCSEALSNLEMPPSSGPNGKDLNFLPQSANMRMKKSQVDAGYERRTAIKQLINLLLKVLSISEIDSTACFIATGAKGKRSALFSVS